LVERHTFRPLLALSTVYHMDFVVKAGSAVWTNRVLLGPLGYAVDVELVAADGSEVGARKQTHAATFEFSIPCPIFPVGRNFERR
jgi:hypothetical protein